MSHATPETPAPKSHALRGLFITLFLLLIGAGAAGWWLIGPKVYTDDQSIRVREDDASLREVLWSSPRTIEEALKAEAINTEADEYEPALSPDGTELYFVRGMPGTGSPPGMAASAAVSPGAQGAPVAAEAATSVGATVDAPVVVPVPAPSHADLFVSFRRNNRWTPPVPLASINSPGNELGPRLSSDGRWLYFYSDRAGGLGGYDIWAARRSDSADAGVTFDAPINLGPAINSPHNEFNPAPSPDGQRLFFTTNRIAAGKAGDTQRWNATIRHNPAATDYDLFVAVREQGQGQRAQGQGEGVETSEKSVEGNGKRDEAKETKATTEISNLKSQIANPTSEIPNPKSQIPNPKSEISFSPALEIPGINTPFHEGACTITAAGDFLYFASNRDGASTGYDLFRVRLRVESAKKHPGETGIAAGLRFGRIEKIKELTTASDEADPALSPEGFRLLFSANTAGGQGGYDLYVSDSREVFTDRDARSLPALGWSWWALIAATALLLLLLLLFRRIDSERLSILQKCVIASLMLHLIFTIVTTLLIVSAQIVQHVKEEEMRIAVSLTAGTEIDIRTALRSQEADLPVQAPAMEASARTSTPLVIPRTPSQELPLNLPTAKAAPTADSMVLPQLPAPKASPSEQTPATVTPVTPIELALDTSQPQVKPLENVESKSEPTPPAPAQAQRQASDAPPVTQPTVRAPSAAPAQSSEAPLTQAAEAQRVASATAASDPVRPTAAQPAAAPNVEFTQADAARVKSERPAEQPNFVTSAAAMRQSVTITSTREQPTANQASPSKPSAQSLLDSPAPQAPAASTKATQSVATTAALPAGVMPTPSLNVQAKAVSSERPDGPAIPQTSPSIERQAATQPRGEVATATTEAPPAEAAAASLQRSAAPAQARSTSEQLAAILNVKVDAPQLEVNPAPAARVKAEQAAQPAASDATPATAERSVEATGPATASAATIDSASPAPAARPVDVNPAAAASEAPRATAKAAATQPVTPNAALPAGITPELSTPQTSARVATSKSADQPQADAASNDGVARTQKQALDSAASRNIGATDSTPTTAPPTANASPSSLVQSADAQQKPATTAASVKAPSSTATPAPALALDIETPTFDASRVAASSAKTAAEPAPATEARIAKATTSAAPVKFDKSTDLASAGLSPTDAALISLASATSSKDLRATSKLIPGIEAGTPAPIPVSVIPGGDQFIAPPLSQRAPEMRKKLLEDAGGTKESEEAVGRALAFLSRQQEPDGRWTFVNDGGKPGKRAVSPHDSALTGLCVLAFLASDHAPTKEGPYRKQVADGVAFLLKMQGKDGDLRGDGNMYNHAIATIALAEAALMTGDERYRAAALKAARFIAKGQNHDLGGWRYQPGIDSDLSVLGWQVMALHSAEQLGFDFDDTTRRGINKYLAKVTAPNSLVAGYTNPTPRLSMTAEGAFTRILMGETFSARQLQTLNDYVLAYPPGRGETDYYYIYYASLTYSQLRGKEWDRWNPAMRQHLEKMQKRGGWQDGSWSPVNRWDQKGGVIYTTCMATLTLEVFYRYLPMYGREAQGPEEAGKR